MAYGAAPSLPDSYNRRLVGRPASPQFGPCGMAAALRGQVVVGDIATDERWADDWCGLALAHGLRACWSTPILSPAGEVLGTFAVYWGAPAVPGRAHQDVIHQMTHIAALAIERERAAVSLARAGPPAAGGLAGKHALRDRYASLTPREREVMTWVVAGLPNKRIGAELGTAEITVKVHRGRVMRKMGAESLADLVRMASRLDVPLPRQQAE
jgi:DNA-binding CsgD family transcriptional regulator